MAGATNQLNTGQTQTYSAYPLGSAGIGINTAANASLTSILASISSLFMAATYLPTATVLMSRDANSNTRVNSLISNFQTFATSGGTTALTVTSPFYTQFTGTSNQTVTLPQTSTCVVGQPFFILNRSTGTITVNTFTGLTVQILSPQSQLWATVTSIASDAVSSWDDGYSVGTALINPMIAVGDMIYGNTVIAGFATPTRIPGNTTSTIEFLSSTGTGSSATAPVWTGFTAPTTSIAYLSGIGTGGFLTSASNYGYVFTITSASAVVGDVYQNSATVTITDATPGVVTTSVAHNLVPNTPVKFSTTNTLPSPLNAGQTYYVSRVPSTTTFQVSLIPGGVSIATSSAGIGTQTLLYGSFTVGASTSSQPAVVTTSPQLTTSATTVDFTGAPTVSAIQPIAPPVSGTLAKVSGSGPSTLTFTNGQFYNTGYAGAFFTIPTTTLATASAGDVYQDTQTVTITIANPAVITTSTIAHNLIVGQPVTFSTTGALPAAITPGTTYYVSAVPTSVTFQISNTQYGNSLSTLGDTQSGTQTVNRALYTVAPNGGITNYISLFTTQSSGYIPAASGTLTKISGAGGSSATIPYSSGQPLATYTVPTSPRQPLYIEVIESGAGGGGAAGSGETSGNPGSASVFGTLLTFCGGGLGGYQATIAPAYGAGGQPLWNVAPWTGSSIISSELIIPGGNGSSGGGSTGDGFAAGNGLAMGGGPGGTNPLGGSGGGNIQGIFGSYCNAVPNTGAGGGGGSGGTSSTPAGQGGGAGAYAKFLISQSNLQTTYLYAIGAGGLGASAGGTGASGVITIKEYYQ